VGEVIDFSKYKAELESRKNGVASLLKEKGADDELAQFGEQRSEELNSLFSGLGQYDVSLTLPLSLSAEEQQRITGEVSTGINQIREKLGLIVRSLVARVLIAELKVFQYERLQRNGF